jgi:hypothetical protein
MPGIPLLFTDGASSPDRFFDPFPGLFPSEELFPGEVYPDDGPTLDFYATAPLMDEFGVTLTVNPVETVFSGSPTTLFPAGPGVAGQVTSGALGAVYVDQAPLGGDDRLVVATPGQVEIVVDPVEAVFDGGLLLFEGLPTVVLVDPAPVVFDATVPATQGGILLILVPSVREMPPLRLHHLIETPSGRFFRWSEDEPNPANVPSNARFSDTMPGGYESAEATLPRKPGTEFPDLERLSTWHIYGAGGQKAWEGRIERAPRQSGDQVAISPSAVGWQAHLDDDKSAVMNPVDRSLERWTEPSAARRLELDQAGFNIGSSSTAADEMSGVPNLVLSMEGPWSRQTSAESWYTAPQGTKVSQLYASWQTNTSIGLDANFALKAFGGATVSADMLTGAASSGQLVFGTPFVDQYVLQLLYTTPAGLDGVSYEVMLSNVAVVGSPGLPTVVQNNRPFVHASDVVAYAVRGWAPKLRFVSQSETENGIGTIQTSSFLIPHITFPEPTTASEIIKGASRFGLQDWAVWDDKTFWWHDRGATARFWRTRVGPSQLQETGPQIDRVWESVIVQYQDVDGSTRTVGPPGSGANAEDPSLKDLDPENPANKASITRRSLLAMGTSTAAGAVEVGRRFLEEQKQLDSSGQARFVGHVESDRGVFFPYWAVRAGDYVSFIDAADPSPRRVVRSDKDHASRTCTVDLDSPPEGLQALLERLGVVLVDLGVG